MCIFISLVKQTEGFLEASQIGLDRRDVFIYINITDIREVFAFVLRQARTAGINRTDTLSILTNRV